MFWTLKDIFILVIHVMIESDLSIKLWIHEGMIDNRVISLLFFKYLWTRYFECDF